MNVFQLLRHANRAPEVLEAARVTPAWYPLVKRYLGGGEAGYPFRIPLQGGEISVGSLGECRVFWQIFVRHSYALPRRCRTIVDAGANIGMFSVWAALQRPETRIIAVEPSPATFETLCRNVASNGLGERITTVRSALGAEAGERVMRTDADSTMHAVLSRGTVQIDGVAVRCGTLSELLDGQGLAEVDLLKMDIEGAEYEVLLSTPAAVLARVRNINLEYHDSSREHTPEDVIRHLGDAGHVLTSRKEDAMKTGIAYFRHRTAGDD